MTVTGLPRPLPECSSCGDPMPRAVWRTRRVCAGCATPAERMAAQHRAAELERATTSTTARVNSRIEALAARRAARTAPTPQERTA